MCEEHDENRTTVYAHNQKKPQNTKNPRALMISLVLSTGARENRENML